MKALNKYIFLLMAISVLLSCKGGTEEPSHQDDPILKAACRYIQGGGSSATGGSMGTVYTVTTLTDSLDRQSGLPIRGSLRYAVNQTGVRLVVFRVSGTIHLTEPLVISKSDITILGQSAPGDGICLADYPLMISKANNVIIRFVRCRLGQVGMKQKGEEYDALSAIDGDRIVIDHCSCSWSIDECVSCYGNTNFTMQYCFITESLRDAGHPKGAHGYGGIWGGKNASFHHNLLAHHDSRNPRFDHDFVDTICFGPIDYVNNVVYNWCGNSAYGGEGSSNGGGGRHINFVNNYYKPGPATPAATSNLKDVGTRLVDPWTSCGNCTKQCGGSVVAPKIYMMGNTMTSSDAVTADNWKGSTKAKSVAGVNTRWTDGLTTLVNEQTAEQAYETVLAKAGCSLSRDSVDLRIVNEVRNKTGKIIDSPDEVGGWPELKTAARPQDSDGDGIPDEWENKHGLNPSKPSDAHLATLVTGFSNLEVYLNDLVKHLY